VEQIKKNEEERSLQAEHREQEKEQMLAYLDRLQEEDLQVTDHQAMLRFPTSSSKALQGFRAQGLERFLSFLPRRAYAHFTTSPPSSS
jgi:hypothetical protein